MSCVLDLQLCFLTRLTNLTPLCLKSLSFKTSFLFDSTSGYNSNEANETETNEEYCLASRRQAEEGYVLSLWSELAQWVAYYSVFEFQMETPGLTRWWKSQMKTPAMVSFHSLKKKKESDKSTLGLHGWLTLHALDWYQHGRLKSPRTLSWMTTTLLLCPHGPAIDQACFSLTSPRKLDDTQEHWSPQVNTRSSEEIYTGRASLAT